MQFISTMKQQSYTLQLANTEVVKTNVGNIVIPNKGKRIVFSKLVESFHTPHLTANGGQAWGILDTEKSARDTGLLEADIIFIPLPIVLILDKYLRMNLLSYEAL